MHLSANTSGRSDPDPSGLMGTRQKALSAAAEKRSFTMDDILSIEGASTLPSPKRQMTKEKIMKAIIVTDQAAGTAGMKLLKRPQPQAAINDVIVQGHASGFVATELEWPSPWTDRLDRDRTPSIPGHELAGVVTALGYGTTGLSVGQRVFGLADWYRDGTLAEYVAIEARNVAAVPGDVDFTVGAS